MKKLAQCDSSIRPKTLNMSNPYSLTLSRTPIYSINKPIPILQIYFKEEKGLAFLQKKKHS